MKREVPYVVFGACGQPNKTLVAYKKNNHFVVSVCQIADGASYEYGDKVALEDIVGEYVQLHFCKRESLEWFCKSLLAISADEIEHNGWEDAAKNGILEDWK